MATLTTLLADTRNLLDDNATIKRWSDAFLTQYLNEAQYEFNQLTQLYKATQDVNLVNNQREYAFTSLIGPILRVETFKAGTPPTRANLNLTTEERLDTLKSTWFNEAAVSTAPTRFIRAKLDYDTIIVYPTPNATAVTNYGALRAYGAALPTTLASGSDVPDIPTQYHQALPYGSAYRALLLNQDADSATLANAYKTRFNEFVAMGQADNKVSLTSGTTIQGTV
jgi:hypothetical protein